MAKRYELNMNTGPLAPTILQFALPLMLSSILQLLYNAADIVIVGRFEGSTALSAVGSNSSLIHLIVNMFVGLSVGAGVYFAQAIGANDYDRCHQTVHTAMTTGAIVGFFLAIFGFFACKPLLILMGTPADVIDQATLYMKIYFLGMPGFMVYTFGSAIMRTVGDTKRPLVFLSISGLVNVILNLILVIIFHLGVAGVAIATIVSQYLSALFVVLSLIKSDGNSRLYIKELKIHGRTLLQMIKIGVPVAIQSSVFSFSNVLIQSSVNSFGSEVMAGNAAAANIEGFLYVAMNAFSQAVTTFVAQNFGAKQYKRINHVFLWCLLFTTILGVVVGPMIHVFGESLLKMYSTDSNMAIAYGMIRLKYICCLYVACGIMEVVSGAIRGIGSTLLPMIVSIIGVCGVRIVWIFTVFQHFHTLPSLYISYIVSWTFTVFAHSICYVYVSKTMLNKKPLE